VISLTPGRLNPKIITEDQSLLGYRLWTDKELMTFSVILCFQFHGAISPNFLTNHQFLDPNIWTIWIHKMQTAVFCKTRLLINRNGILTIKAGC
jgi:hypothetical protein